MTVEQIERQTTALETIAKALSCIAAKYGVHPEEIEDEVRFDTDDSETVNSPSSVTKKVNGIRSI